HDVRCEPGCERCRGRHCGQGRQRTVAAIAAGGPVPARRRGIPTGGQAAQRAAQPVFLHDPAERSMIVRRFLLWARTAPAEARASGAAALAGAYLRSGMSDDDRHEAETALMALIDDPSPLVRRAIAEE